MRDVQQHGAPGIARTGVRRAGIRHVAILPVGAAHQPRFLPCDRFEVLLTDRPRGAAVEDVTIRVPLVTRAHIDLGRVWSAACPGL
ncbi:hypothetical protein GCM10010464_66210 [Pseudonocardia yunnanensis]